MKKYFLRKQTLFALPALIVIGCSTSQRAQQEQQVGIVTYNQYTIKTPTATADTSFYVITNQEAFDAAFATSNPDQLPKPGFSGQTVVAIAVPANGAAKIERATLKGKDMLIYASTCNKETTDCPKNGLTLVTAPKSGSVKNVQFFINGIHARTIDMK